MVSCSQTHVVSHAQLSHSLSHSAIKVWDFQAALDPRSQADTLCLRTLMVSRLHLTIVGRYRGLHSWYCKRSISTFGWATVRIRHWQWFHVLQYRVHVTTTIVTLKSAHGRSTLQVCQRGGWVFFSLSVFEFSHKRVSMSCLRALEANNWTNNSVQWNHQ